MLALLRIVFGFALFAIVGRAVEVAGPTPRTEGTTDAGYLAAAVIVGILNAIVWAPVIGQWMADPLTGAFTAGHPADFRNRLLQFAHKLANRGWRRLALFFAFLEGVRHPDLPGAFILGLNHARPGSWLEKVFAREVWRFDNADHCLRAWRILKARGIELGLHRRAEVNLLLLAQQREVPPDAEVLPVPAADPPPAPKRHAAIELFEGAPSGKEEPAPTPADRGDSNSPGPGAARAGESMASSVDSEVASGNRPLATASPEPPAGAPREASADGAGGAGPAALSLRERLRVLFTGRLRS